MEHQLLYNLSVKFSPPSINLRDAEILNSYGMTTWAKIPINHKHPDDVKRKELDYYKYVYPFMNFNDLLFYFYPIAKELERNKKLECRNSFLYNFSRCWKDGKKHLSSEDYLAIKDGIQWMWDIGGCDFSHCKNLLLVIGV